MLIPGCSYSYKNHSGELKTPEQTHRAMEECGCKRCQNAMGEPELGPRVRVVPEEELNRSDLRAQAHFPKEPSPEMTIVDLKAKLGLWPDVEPHILKAYFEYAFEDVDSWDDLTKGERRVLTPETFTRIREWAFGKKEESSAPGL